MSAMSAESLHLTPPPWASARLPGAGSHNKEKARMPAARAQPPGAPHTAKSTLTAPSPPSPLRHAVKCLVGVVGRRVSIVSRVSGSQGSRVNGSRGPNGFKGTKNLRVSGFQGIEGIPMLTGLSKVWRFQNPKPPGSKGSRAL